MNYLEFKTKITEMNLKLPTVAMPVANYLPYKVVLNGVIRPILDLDRGQINQLFSVYISGQVSRDTQGNFIIGKLGKDLSVEQGYQAGKMCGLYILAALNSACNLTPQSHIQPHQNSNPIQPKNGSKPPRTSRFISHISAVKIGGFVNCTPDFSQHPQVINGCSDLMVKVLGESGKHARTAIGVQSLPLNVAVEIDAIFQICVEGSIVNEHKI